MRRTSCLSSLFVALAILLPGAGAAHGVRWDEHVAAGAQAYRESRFDEAERHFAEAVVFAERAIPREWHLVTSLTRLADTVRAQGRDGDAEALYRRALAVAEELRAGEDPSLLDPVRSLAAFYQGSLRYADAERFYERGLALLQKGHDRESAAYLHILSDLLQAQRKYTEAETLLRRALSLIERSGGPDDSSLAAMGAALSDLVMLLRIQGQTADSEIVAERAANVFAQAFDRLELRFRQALAVRMRVFGPHHPGLVNNLYYLARLLETRQRYGEAESFHRRALEILNSVGGAHDLSLAAGLETYAALLRKMGRETEARLREARAAAIRGTSSRHEVATTPVAELH